MKLTDIGYGYLDYKGQVDTVQYVLETYLNGNENGPNLVPVKFTKEGLLDIEHYRGTILSPAQYLKTVEGNLVPGLLYHRLLEIKTCIFVTETGTEDAGVFFDLSKMGVSLHTHSMGKNKIEDVRDAALIEFERRHDAVLDRHAGPVLRGVASFDPRLAETELAISSGMAEDMAEAFGVESVLGLNVICLRFPVIGRESIQHMIIRIIEDDLLSIRIYDKTIKRMGGDYDGDQLMITVPEGKDLVFTATSTLPRLPDPSKFEAMSFSLTNMRAFAWPDQVTAAAGMTAKNLQGIITNFFKRIGLAAHALFNEQKGN